MSLFLSSPARLYQGGWSTDKVRALWLSHSSGLAVSGEDPGCRYEPVWVYVIPDHYQVLNNQDCQHTQQLMCVVLRIEPTTLHVLEKNSTTKLHPQPPLPQHHFFKLCVCADIYSWIQVPTEAKRRHGGQKRARSPGARVVSRVTSCCELPEVSAGNWTLFLGKSSKHFLCFWFFVSKQSLLLGLFLCLFVCFETGLHRETMSGGKKVNQWLSTADLLIWK